MRTVRTVGMVAVLGLALVGFVLLKRAFDTFEWLLGHGDGTGNGS